MFANFFNNVNKLFSEYHKATMHSLNKDRVDAAKKFLESIGANIPEDISLVIELANLYGELINLASNTSRTLSEENHLANIKNKIEAIKRKQSLELSKAFLEELGAKIPDSNEDVIKLATLLKELMALSSLKEKDSKHLKRLLAVKDELAEIAAKSAA